MAFENRDYAGAAVQTTITAGINATDLSISIASATGWPSGGANGPFFIVIDRGLAGEEKVEVQSRTGTTLTVASTGKRGIDGTVAASHSSGATITHAFIAQDADEANQHYSNTGLDHHTQYLNNTRHDLTARHTLGSVIPAAGTPSTITPDAAASAGASNNVARVDHAHAIAAATAVTSGLANAEGVSTSFARADHTHDQAALSVGTPELVDGSVNAAKLASASVDFVNLVANRGILIVQGTDPGAVGANRIWLNTTKLALLCRNAGNSAWDVLMTFGTGVNYTPTLYNFTVGGSGINVARYIRHGRTILVNGFIEMNTGATTNASPFFIGLPPTAAAANTGLAKYFYHGAARGFDISTGGAFAAVGLIRGGVSNAGGTDFDRIGIFATAGVAAWNNTTPFTWFGPDQDGFSWFAEYEAASAEDANFV